MSYTAPQGGDSQISRAHRTALSTEIGERLRSDLDRNLTDTPPHLLQLMKRFHDAPAAVRWLDARDLA